IRQGLSKEPDRRPATMEDILARLEEVQRDLPAELGARPRRRTRWLGVGAVGACGAALALALAVPLARSSPPVKPPSAAQRVRVVLESSPAGAEVTLGDEVVGTTPCE